MSNQETDPTGRQPNTPGAKLDAGKAPVFRGAIQYFPRALIAVSEVSEHGARKYTWKGWEDVPDGIARYGDAMARHITKEGIEQHDIDSGLLHAAHAAWNALARLELILRDKDKPVEEPDENDTLSPSKGFLFLVKRVRKISHGAANYMLGQGRKPLPNEDREVRHLAGWSKWSDTSQGYDFWNEIDKAISQAQPNPVEAKPVETVQDARLIPSQDFLLLVERVRKIDPLAAEYMLGEHRDALPGEKRQSEYLRAWCCWWETIQGEFYWININDKLIKMIEDERRKK
jgi:hypothetical protein